MVLTRIGLGGAYPSSAKLYAPIFTNKNSPLKVSMSIAAQSEHVKNTSITVVYWDNVEKKIIKDYLAGTTSTPIDFTIEKPTSIPPFMIFLETSGLYGVIDIGISYDTRLIVGTISDYDEKLMEEDNILLPEINNAELSQISSKDTYTKLIIDTTEIARRQASPLVIDLDGDGVVETNKEDSGIHFDHDDNGFAEKSGWVGKDDGLLVRDINGNGQIDNGTELFGNNSVLSSGQKAA